jgi:hypothetical protein
VPQTWPSGTYDYFSIIEYGNQGSDVPTRFSMVKQEFGGDYDDITANDWDEPNSLDPENGCDLKGAQERGWFLDATSAARRRLAPEHPQAQAASISRIDSAI